MCSWIIVLLSATATHDNLSPLPDPTYHPGTQEERAAYTLRVAQRLRTKIEGLLELDFSGDPGEIQKRLDFLGEI